MSKAKIGFIGSSAPSSPHQDVGEEPSDSAGEVRHASLVQDESLEESDNAPTLRLRLSPLIVLDSESSSNFNLRSSPGGTPWSG